VAATERNEEDMSKTLTIDTDDLEQITKLRSEGKKWDEISEAMNMAPGKAMLIYSSGQVPPKERIKDAGPADVKRLRDDLSLSWGAISVRCGLPESTCRGMYREAGGNDKGNRIGKGGRHPGGTNGQAVASKPSGRAVKAASKPTAVAVDQFADSTEDEIRTALESRAIKVDLGSGEVETIGVRTVKRAAKGKVVLVDGNTGASRTIKTASILQVSKRPVKFSA